MELKEQFIEITHLIVTAKNNAYRAVNKELVNLYWQIGAYLSNKVKQDEWGKSVVKELAKFIQQTEPSIRGFSSQNLWRMKQFYETYQDNSKLSTLSREISWSHNTAIFSTAKTLEEMEFYIRLVIKEKLSFRELQRQMDSSYYERIMITKTKLSTLSRVFPEELSQTFKDTYVLELLQLPENHLEKDLRKAIAQNSTQFLLEFGRDFAFMGEEKPSIGILLCKDKDDTVVEYALSRSLSPTLVADYKTKLPDKALLQKKWGEIIATLNLEEE